MWIIAVAIIIAACIIADGRSPRRGGGYQPRSGGKLGTPHTGGSGVMSPRRYTEGSAHPMYDAECRYTPCAPAPPDYPTRDDCKARFDNSPFHKFPKVNDGR